MRLPRLYAIVDAACFPQRESLFKTVRALVAGGATLLQYRDKSGDARQMLENAIEIKRIASDAVQLIMNDRADLAVMAGFDGVHLGQDDLSDAGARRVVGERFIVGRSTHNEAQLAAADASSADYRAIGPVFSTASKANPDPVVGLEGVRRARALTAKPIVAIGGINRANCRQVIDAGADSVAVIADLLAEPQKSVEQFLHILR